MGSDGESDQASGTSSDEVQSPTGVCLRNRIHRRISMEVTIKNYKCACLRVCACAHPHAHVFVGLTNVCRAQCQHQRRMESSCLSQEANSAVGATDSELEMLWSMPHLILVGWGRVSGAKWPVNTWFKRQVCVCEGERERVKFKICLGYVNSKLIS